MNWLIKTYTHKYSVWLKIRFEKSESNRSFFPKVIKFFFLSNQMTLSEKKILILFFSPVWQNNNQTLKEKSWTSSDYHQFYHFIMYKVRFEKIHYLCHWLIFFQIKWGEKTIFHCAEIMCKVDFHILSLVKKNLKSKFQSSIEIYVCKISFSRISKPIVPNID